MADPDTPVKVVALECAGMALRTLVYHDILLSYMAYIKQRGYCAMFIWACPPFQVCCQPPASLQTASQREEQSG